MAQITHETIRCIEEAFARGGPDAKFPLTAWEQVQLARAWVELQRREHGSAGNAGVQPARPPSVTIIEDTAQPGQRWEDLPSTRRICGDIEYASWRPIAGVASTAKKADGGM